jgi:hypothetical protein
MRDKDRLEQRMRDMLILAIILSSLPICFLRPFFGVLVWVLVAYFNP